MPQHDDDIYLGRVESGGRVFGTASATQMLRGIGPAGRIYAIDMGVPTVTSITAVCASQTILAAGNALINGGSSSMDFTRGQRTATFAAATSRIGICCQMKSTSAGDTTQTVTVTGRDIFGQRMSEARVLTGTTPVLMLKAFKNVDIVSVSAALAGSLQVGGRDCFGFPIRVDQGGQLIMINWGGGYGPDPGTAQTSDNTDPATSLTGDVRGTYTPSSAVDGVKRWSVTLMLTDGMVGPNATRKQAFGVTQA